uniref:Uncharacterized protein n=1 Tax=Rhizophora mucronata TaxID=61149 RepID=A0A2P2P1G9_RHIMU
MLGFILYSKYIKSSLVLCIFLVLCPLGGIVCPLCEIVQFFNVSTWPFVACYTLQLLLWIACTQ